MVTLNSVVKGQLGEKKAEVFLIERGYKILERNYRSKYGEIDLIGEKDNSIVFVEVKSWNSFREELGKIVDKKKWGKIKRTAAIYLDKMIEIRKKRFQFDLIYIDTSNNRVEHFENIYI